MPEVHLEILRLPSAKDDIPLPQFQTSGAAGMDLHGAHPGEITIQPGGTACIPTGIAIAIPLGYEGQIRPRSGLAARHQVTVLNSPGTIDSDYRGEIQVLLINHGNTPYTVHRKDRIAQLVIAPIVQPKIVTVTKLPETARGPQGLGHTGI